MMKTIIFILFVRTVVGDPTTIHEIKNSGVLFEDIGQVVTYQSYWTFLSQIKIPEWGEALSFVETCETTITSLCNSIQPDNNETNCEHWTKDIKGRTKNIREKISEIQMFAGCKHQTRHKRGLVNLIGTISKFVFGTMDSNDSEYIYQKLEELENTKDTSVDLARKQLTILKTNTKVMGDALVNLTEHVNYLAGRQEKFNQAIKVSLTETKSELAYIHILSRINEVGIFAMGELQKISDHLTSILFILESIQMQEISPLMIPASEFSALYSNITNGNPKLLHDFIMAKMASKTYSVCAHDRFLIKIMLPILEKPFMTLNKVYTLPIPAREGGYTIFENLPSYFLNCSFTHRNSYLTELQMHENCRIFNSTLHICKTRQPIRLLPVRSCIQELFDNQMSNSSLCSYRFLRNFESFIIPLEHENSWLYWTHNMTILYSQCKEAFYSNKLQGLGILKVNRECEFRIGQFMIPYHPVAQYSLTFYQPDNISYPNMSKYKPLLEKDIAKIDFPRTK